jgi:SPP1 family predicted phage head-tail adaptor
MMSGRLDRRITIQMPAATRDEEGGKVDNFTTVATVWAQKIDIKGQEIVEGGQFVPRAEIKFRIRYRDDFDESARIVFESTNYDIVQIAEIGRREGREILAKKP